MVEKYKIYTGFLFSSFWLLVCHGFIFDDFFPGLEFLKSPIRVFCDFVFLTLGLISLRTRRDIIMTVLLAAIILASKIANSQTWVETLNGFRFYIPLMVSIPILRYMLVSKNACRFVRSMDLQLLYFLYIQAVVMTFQFLRYGANDNVGGTFGFGGSGPVSTLIYVISFYLLNKHWNFEKSWVENFSNNKQYIFLLFPTFLNETKISFIFILVYFLLLIKRDRKFIIRVAFLSPLAAIIVCALGFVYLKASAQNAEEVFTIENINTYLTGGEDAEELVDLAIMIQYEGLDQDDQSIWALDLPRFIKLYKTRTALKDSKGGILLGAGVGQFKGGTIIGKTHFARKNAWLLKGSIVSLFWILIELGLLGAIWLIVTLVYLLRLPLKGTMGINLKIYLSIIWGLILIYDTQFSTMFTVFITTYVAMTGLQSESCQRVTASASDNKRRG